VVGHLPDPPKRTLGVEMITLEEARAFLPNSNRTDAEIAEVIKVCTALARLAFEKLQEDNDAKTYE